MTIEAIKVSKRFPGVLALREVSLEARSGEVLAVVGENGAGKSTLMKILAGDLRPDGGELRLRGRSIRFREPRDAMRAGVVLIHQELSLANNLDVGANVVLGRESHRGPFIRGRSCDAAARRALQRVGLGDLDLRSPVDRLGMGTRQLVEIARALATDVEVLIMDEPTSSLSDGEVGRLFDTISDLRRRGVAVIYISHRLAEIERIADRVVILRDGVQTAMLEGSSIDRDSMISGMVGRAFDATPTTRPLSTSSEPPRLALRGFRTSRFPDVPVDLAVGPGQIVVLGGLVGAGRTELLRAVVGIDAPVDGEVLLDGRRHVIRHPADGARAGVVLVPEDRKADGVFLDESVIANLTMPGLANLAWRGFWRRFTGERRHAASMIDRFDVRTSGLATNVGTLSGGNQQKVAVGRWAGLEPRLFLLDEPTRGVDVAAKAEIHRLLRELADRGASIVAASSEMEELLSVADRVVVMHDGAVAGDLSREDATETAVMALATGGSARMTA